MSFPEILRFFIRISLRIIGTGSSTRNSEPMYLSPMIPVGVPPAAYAQPHPQRISPDGAT